MAEALKYKHERFTFVSGIGCSSRFPYYMNTFGFHGIHGRASAIATGVKVANPKLSVWQVTGDGDALAIGGNHFIHAVRRNIDINIMLFNNEIYGLTKGQYSPTSKLGKITKTSPFGTIEHPFNPGELVLGARGTFFARSIDVELKLTQECLVAAAKHDGTSVVEILQNCVIFNDKTHAGFALNKEIREENTITLRHGERMIFGRNRDKGLVQIGMKLMVVRIGEGGVTEEEFLRAKAQVKASYIMGMETVASRATYIGRNELIEGRAVEPEEVLAQMDRLCPDDIGRLAEQLLAGPWALSAAGPVLDREAYTAYL